MINKIKLLILKKPYFFLYLSLLFPIPLIFLSIFYLSTKNIFFIFLLSQIYYVLIFYFFNYGKQLKNSNKLRSPFEVIKRLHTTSNKPQWDKYGKDCHHLIGVEVGVWEGRNALRILNNVNLIKLYLVDPWHSYDRNNDLFIPDKPKDHELRYQKVYKMFLNNKKVEIIRKTSEDAAKDFADNSLDFVYLDGDHSYEFMKKDLELWYPKVKLNGVLCGDDYGHLCGHGVVKAVDEFSFQKKVVIHTINDNQFWFIKSFH